MKGLIILAVAIASALPITAQMSFPFAVSQRGMMMQRVGVTDITVDYGRPGVNGRSIWGGLVPYDQVWRCGANENTTITFSTDVKVNGNNVKAGRYGVHMIPTKGDWTIILNSDSHAWGSYFYNKDNDVLRTKATPKEHAHTELLTFAAPTVSRTSATIEMQWEKIAVPFTVSVDLEKTVSADLSRQLTGLAGFTATNYVQAASWLAQNNMNLELAKQWAQRANAGSPTFQSLMLSANLADKDGDTDEAEDFRKQAVEIATNAELNAFGYSLLQAGKAKEAIPYFVLNAERHPTDPNVWDSLGEAYATAKMKNDAIKAFKKSLSMNPPPAVKQNSEKWLKQLQ